MAREPKLVLLFSLPTLNFPSNEKEAGQCPNLIENALTVKEPDNAAPVTEPAGWPCRKGKPVIRVIPMEAVNARTVAVWVDLTPPVIPHPILILAINDLQLNRIRMTVCFWQSISEIQMSRLAYLKAKPWGPVGGLPRGIKNSRMNAEH